MSGKASAGPAAAIVAAKAGESSAPALNQDIVFIFRFPPLRPASRSRRYIAINPGIPQPRKTGRTAWVRRTFPGHVHAFWGAVVAVVVALLTFAIGLPRMLLIAILVLIGIALGQVLDGDPKIIRTIRDLFSSDRER
jgi:uncharacterized membrane protein